MKVGALIGHYQVRVNDSTFVSNTTANPWGFTVGAGMDVPVSQRFSLGALVEYDQYKKISGGFSNSYGPTGTSYRMTPTMVNFMLTLSYKIATLLHK